MNSASENSRAISELIRFATVSALCGAIDLAAGLCVLAIWQPPTYTAALIGWSGGVVSGYLLHLCWTFSGKDTPGSWGGSACT